MSLAPVIDLSSLPAPAVVETLDFEVILAAMKADLLVRYPTLTAVVLESEPAAKVLETCAYREVLLRQRVNDAARAIMLAYAVGPDLDQIGARYDTPRLPGELDPAYRPAIQQGFHALAAAGPYGAYRQHALRADASIADVSVVSLADGEVTVCVLAPQVVDAQGLDPALAAYGAAAFPALAATLDPSKAAVIGGADIPALMAVRTALNDEDVRPLTDAVIVRPPSPKGYAIEAELELYPGPDSAPVLAQARADLAAYQASVRKIGYDVTLAGLYDALVVPGVRNVKLTSPTMDVIVGDTEIALCLGVTLTVAAARTP